VIEIHWLALLAVFFAGNVVGQLAILFIIGCHSSRMPEQDAGCYSENHRTTQKKIKGGIMKMFSKILLCVIFLTGSLAATAMADGEFAGNWKFTVRDGAGKLLHTKQIRLCYDFTYGSAEYYILTEGALSCEDLGDFLAHNTATGQMYGYFDIDRYTLSFFNTISPAEAAAGKYEGRCLRWDWQGPGSPRFQWTRWSIRRIP